MKKDFKLLATLLYFVPVSGLLFLLYFPGSLPDYASGIVNTVIYFGIGCLYSFFIVIFLFSLDKAIKPRGLELKLFLTLSVTWIALFIVSMYFVGPILGAILFGFGSIVTMFLSTLTGTFLFYKILSTWDKFPKIAIRNMSLRFSALTSIITIPLLETTTNTTFGQSTSVPPSNIILVCIVWQIVMTYFLWRRMAATSPLTAGPSAPTTQV